MHLSNKIRGYLEEVEGKKGEEGKIRQEEERKKNIQPINNSIMGTLKQELVNYPIYPHCPTDQLESCILGFYVIISGRGGCMGWICGGCWEWAIAGALRALSEGGVHP